MTVQRADFGDQKPSYYNLGLREAPTLAALRIWARVTALKEFRNLDTDNNAVFSMQVDKVLSLSNSEKKRAAIKEAREHHLNDLWKRDIPRYRECRRVFSKWIKTGEDKSDQFSSPWQNIELKHSHMLWAWRNLYILKLIEDNMPQMDLFSF